MRKNDIINMISNYKEEFQMKPKTQKQRLTITAEDIMGGLFILGMFVSMSVIPTLIFG
jgi:hypothetical protein